MNITRFFLAAICCGIFIASTAQNMLPNAATIGGRKLVWSDEFNYNGLPDPKKWGYEEGFVRNKEPQFYTTKRLENARVENGNLVLEARKENYKGAAYTSASIITLGKESWKYGRIEVRAKVPKGLGVWPAIWMLGENRTEAKWPKCGEIDIMEFLGKDSSKVYGTVHYADSANQYRHKGEGPVVGAPYDGFHIYAIDWDKNGFTYYYDNLKYFVFDFKKAEYNPQDIFQKKFYLLLNLALGHQGAWAGPVDDKALPVEYLVDYVRVYQ